MSSIDSQQERATPEQSLQEQLELDSNTARLGRMSGIRSNARNLRAEDRAVERNIEAHERELHGDNYDELPPEEEMVDIMAARDVHYHQNSPVPANTPPPQPAPVAPSSPPRSLPPAPTREEPPATGMTTAQKAMAAAALVAAGAVPAAVLTYAMTPTKPASTSPAPAAPVAAAPVAPPAAPVAPPPVYTPPAAPTPTTPPPAPAFVPPTVEYEFGLLPPER